jgi:hypothetical protein
LKAQRLLHHSTLGVGVIKKEKKVEADLVDVSGNHPAARRHRRLDLQAPYSSNVWCNARRCTRVIVQCGISDSQYETAKAINKTVNI